MTDTYVADWSTAFDRYRAARAEVDRLNRLPDDEDPHLVAMAAANEVYLGALQAVLRSTPPHLTAFGEKLAIAPAMVEFDALCEDVLPRLRRDWLHLIGGEAAVR